MSIFEAIILGIVQGVTEFIPVSSSGHLLLVHELFGTSDDTLSFDVALHVGTLLALLLYFRKDIYGLAKNLFDSGREGRLARLLILATIPAGLAGLLFNDFIEDTVRSPVVVAIMLAAVGVLMLIVDRSTKRAKQTDVTTEQGFKIGLAQVLALIPGTSRSGITMTIGMLVGLGRVQAARFSFLLAIPIISGSALGVLLKDQAGVAAESSLIGVGIAASFVSGLLAIRFLMHVIARVGLKPFAIYRIALAFVVLVVLL